MINALVVENFKQWNHTGFTLSSCVACHVTPFKLSRMQTFILLVKVGLLEVISKLCGITGRKLWTTSGHL